MRKDQKMTAWKKSVKDFAGFSLLIGKAGSHKTKPRFTDEMG